MEQATSELGLVLAGALAATALGLLKWLGPTLREKVPNFLWPIIIYAFTYAGTGVCQWLGATCQGDPTQWGDAEAQAAAGAFVAVVIRELTRFLSVYVIPVVHSVVPVTRNILTVPEKK